MSNSLSWLISTPTSSNQSCCSLVSTGESIMLTLSVWVPLFSPTWSSVCTDTLLLPVTPCNAICFNNLHASLIFAPCFFGVCASCVTCPTHGTWTIPSSRTCSILSISPWYSFSSGSTSSHWKYCLRYSGGSAHTFKCE